MRNAHPHRTGPFPQPKAFAPWYRWNGWATSAGHKGRMTGRQPATRSARRASRSLHLAALAAPHPPCSSPRPTPTTWAFAAPAGCSPGPKRPPRPACGLPAGPELPAAGASAALHALLVCLGPAATTAPLFEPYSVWRLSGVFASAGGAVLALGGCRNVFGGQGLNRPVLSFRPFLQCHPLSFAAS